MTIFSGDFKKRVVEGRNEIKRETVAGVLSVHHDYGEVALDTECHFHVASLIQIALALWVGVHDIL